MAERINLDTQNPTLNELFAKVPHLKAQPPEMLSKDELALVQLHDVVAGKGEVNPQVAECFICITGA